ncbi:hypothetical protein GUJ93_ZPchr0012g20830 [Zizania palustris]|uniref:Uncharacterized protein n=1 Tax=Zizania palustris TaxID=103762 RepID=A0A8J5WV02_ZIZPA|nr:hypothetical protein GUJ93_ZPchr0012g20830 [Zizania palustris]
MSPVAKSVTGGNRRPRSTETCGHWEAGRRAEGEVGRRGVGGDQEVCDDQEAAKGWEAARCGGREVGGQVTKR